MLIEYHAKSLWDGSYRFQKLSINGAENTVIVDSLGGPVAAAA
jgi:hypothetical protein